jgi:hypothetical protein
MKMPCRGCAAFGYRLDITRTFKPVRSPVAASILNRTNTVQVSAQRAFTRSPLLQGAVEGLKDNGDPPRSPLSHGGMV